MRWLRHGVVVVAGLAVAAGCKKDGTGPAPDYSLSLAPAALTIVQGATDHATVTLTRINFTGAVTLSLGNAPAGVTGSFSPAAPSGTSSTLTVAVGATVAPGVYHLTVDGTGSPGSRSKALTLTVTAAPDYALSLSPAALTIVQGATGNTTVTITRTNFIGAVTLSLGNAPTGVTGAFDPAAPTGTSSTLTVSVGAAVTPGVYDLTVNGTGGPGSRSTPLALTVSPAPTYSLSLAPTALTIVQGATGNATVTITRTNFTAAVTLSLGNAPTGVAGSFDPAAPTGTSSALTVSVSAAVAPGVYDLTVNGTGSPGNRSTPLTLTVSAAPSYTLSLAPATLTIVQGGTGTSALTITRTNFTGAVTLSLGNAPTDVTGSFDPAAPTGTSSALTVSVGAAVAPGVYNLTVDGTGSPGNRSTPLTLTVSAAGDYTLSLTPAELTIEQGATGTSTVTITRTNFTGAVTLSLGNAPAGVTGSFSPAAPAGSNSTVTMSVGAAVMPGVYNLTVDGGGTIGNRSTPLTLTVSAAPAYTLSLSSAALTIGQGANGTTTVTITRTNFGGGVTLSLGNAPAGVTGSFDPAAPTGTTSTLTVSVGAAVAPGVYNLTVDGTATAGNHSTPLTLTVSAEPNYSLSLSPAALTIVQGATRSTTVTITRTNFTGAVTLSLGGAPTGVTGSFNPTAPTGTSSTLTVSVDAGVAPGVYDLTVDGTGTPGNRSTPLTLTVSANAPGSLINGQNRSGTISTAGELHTWTFTATQGDYIALSIGEVAPVSANFEPWIRLVSPTGAVLGNSAGPAAAQIAVTAPTSGTYTVIVGSKTFYNVTDGTGSYSLTLAQAPGAFDISPADDGGAMTNGVTYDGSIFVGDLDMWSFTATQGDYIALSMGENNPVSTSFEPWIRLVSPTGAVVGNSAGPAAAQVAVTALTSGTYTVIVGTKTFYNVIDGTGNYRLTLTKGPGAFELSPGDDGGALTNGATHTGSIYVGDLDIWSFSATQGDYIALSMGEDTPASTSFEPWIRLVSPTGELVGNSIGPAAAQIGVTALTSGTYTVIVGTKTFYNVIDGTGSYRLTLTKGPGAFAISPGDDGGALTNGATHTGSIYVGDLDIWSFTASEGDYIAVSMGEDTPASTSFEPWIRLVSPTGALVGNSAGPAAAQIAVTALTSGTYTVIVGTKTFYNIIDGTGNYRLTLAKGPGAFDTSPGDDGGALTNGTTYAGSIYLGDLDVWSFTATHGDYIAVSMGEVAPMSSSFEPWIRLVSPTGEVVGNSAGPAAAQIGVTAATSGTYTVIVGTKTFYNVIDGTGNYQLTLTKGPGAFELSAGDDGGALTNGATHTGSIYLGDLDIWSFTATAGDYIALSMGEVAPASTSFEPWIRLVSPTGALLGNSIGPSAAQVAVTAPASGTYTVIVGTKTFYNVIDGTGSYRLTLAKGPGAFVTSAGDEGGPMTNGIDYAGFIHLGDLDMWSFTTIQGQAITLNITEVAPASSSFEPWIRLVSPTGVLLGDRAGAAAAQIAVTAPASGTYTVIVGTKTFYNVIDGTGNYVLRVGGATSVDYSLAIEPAALTIAQGATGSATVTVTRTNFTGAVTLSLGNAPAGVTGSFNPAAPTGTSSTLMVGVGAAVAPGVYNLTVDGTGSAGNRSTPLTLTVSVSGGNHVTVSAGSRHTCAVDGTGQAYCWGNNPAGELGDGTTTERRVATVVAGGLRFSRVSAGYFHTCGLTTSGAAYCWGSNEFGQLGDGTGAQQLVPTAVAGGLTFIALDAGYSHTCGVTTSGTAYCWGYGGNGHLGDGATANRVVPTAVVGNLTFTVISADDATCGVTTSGAAYCWGPNSNGQLGDGTTTQRLVPTLVTGGLTFAEVSGGVYHTCGRTTSGSVYCWGGNSNGQLGDNTLTSQSVPTPVTGGFTFASLDAGDAHTCGVTTSRAAFCWGLNGSGQLGDGTTTDRLVPTAVIGGLTFAAVSAGDFHSCGVTTSDALYCWGDNHVGQLGDGTATTRLIPTAVAPPGTEPSPDYALAVSPTALTIVQGASGSTAVTITRTNFTGAVTLTLGNAPAGITGAFDPATPTGTSSALTVTVGVAVSPGVYNLTVDGTGTGGNRSTPLTLTVTTGIVRLTTSPGFDGEPDWSPDGTKIVFQSERDGGDDEIYVMNADGTGVVRLTINAGLDVTPVWSPDGTKIAFRSTRDGNSEIYVMNTDGTGVLRLTNNAARDWQPAWSPDGAKIAFASRRDGDDEIYVMNADGTGVVRLTTSAGDDNQPAWSPDGAKIAFVSTRDGDDEIYVMNADGTGAVRLTTSPGFDSRPAWSRDGAKIAFDSPREGGHSAIYVMNTDGSGVTRLTTGTAEDFAPAWSPDGAKIAFASTRDDPAADIYVMHVF